MELTDEQKARVFDRVYEEYVLEHGLGGMAKSDFDALFLWLIADQLDEIDSFDLSVEMKIKESRVKSLLETAAVKFDDGDELAAWGQLLTVMKTVEFDVESLERGQVRFQLKNPMLFRWLQRQVRRLSSTCSYSRGSEQLAMNLDTLYSLMDWLWEEGALGDHWTDAVLAQAQADIQTAIGHIGAKIEVNSLERLREAKQPKLRKMLDAGAKLASIGSFITPLVELIDVVPIQSASG